MEFNSIADFKRNFATVYHKTVVPQLHHLDLERQQTLKKTLTISVIIGIIGVLTILSHFFIKLSDIFVFIGVIFIICGFSFYSHKTKRFETNLKTRLMPILMPAFGNFNWTSDEVIYTSEIADSKLFSRTDKRKSDDNFYGTYRNMPIEISETYIYYETRDSEGKHHTHTVFEGVIITIGTGKKFTGHTIIRTRNILLNSKCYEEVKLEDPEFSKLFFVDSNDQVEARYLLTTAFMERFKRIGNAFGSKHAECSFRDGKLMLALSTPKDLFKLGALNRPLTDTEPFQVFLNEIIAILEMIDYLKITEKTGL